MTVSTDLAVRDTTCPRTRGNVRHRVRRPAPVNAPRRRGSLTSPLIVVVQHADPRSRAITRTGHRDQGINRTT